MKYMSYSSSKDMAISKTISIENYIKTSNQPDINELMKVAKLLKIRLLGIENITSRNLKRLVEKNQDKVDNTSIITIRDVWDKLFNNNYNLEQQIRELKKIVLSENAIVLFSRRTLNEPNIPKLKSSLGKYRLEYEILAVESNDLSLLKWAVHDRRVDYISLELATDTSNIDVALCSLVKQYGKHIEIRLSPLLQANSVKELNNLIRQGKKLFETLLITKTPFILTMGTGTPYYLRNALQMRALGRILGIPFHKSKHAANTYQLEKLVRNSLKLHSSFIFDGVSLEE